MTSLLHSQQNYGMMTFEVTWLCLINEARQRMIKCEACVTKLQANYGQLFEYVRTDTHIDICKRTDCSECLGRKVS